MNTTAFPASKPDKSEQRERIGNSNDRGRGKEDAGRTRASWLLSYPAKQVATRYKGQPRLVHSLRAGYGQLGQCYPVGS